MRLLANVLAVIALLVAYLSIGFLSAETAPNFILEHRYPNHPSEPWHVVYAHPGDISKLLPLVGLVLGWLAARYQVSKSMPPN